MMLSKPLSMSEVRGLLMFFVLTFASAAQGASLESRACREWRRVAIEQWQNPTGLHSDQIVVAKANGEVLFNWARAPYRSNSRHQLWSASKTISATLVATAIAQGKVQITDRLEQFFPLSLRRNVRGASSYKAVTVASLMDMTSGFRWNERADADPQDVSDLPLMYSEGYKNYTRYLIDTEFAAAPGRVWNYSSLNANLMMAILKKAYRTSYDDMPWANLFRPLGMKSAVFEQDEAGTYIGASYIYLSAEDLTKFGRLFLNDGMVGDQRLLPKGWVEFASQPVAKSYAKVRSRADFKNFGVYSKGGWWLNRPVPGVGKPFPKSPANLLLASGFLGQWLAVLPDQGLVIARTGYEREAEHRHFDNFLSGAIACFAK